MASGGEGTNYFRCSVCFDDGRDTAARHFCLECEAYFCSECVKSHKTLRVLKTHHISDVESHITISEGGSDTPVIKGSDDVDSGGQRLRCSLHHGKLVDTYCRDHDSVCCETCALLDHRSCTKVSIAIASNNFKSTPDVKKSEEALSKTLAFARQEKKKREENLESICTQKQELVEEVDHYEEILIAKIKNLADVSRADIHSKYEKDKTAIENDVETLNALITNINAYTSKLEQAFDETLLFAYVKTILKVTRDGEVLLHDMEQEWKQMKIAYCLDKSLVMNVDGMTSLGQLEDSIVAKAYEATFQQIVNIKMKYEVEANVNSICLMDSGEIIVADTENNKIKRFSSDFIYIDALVLSGQPIAISTTSKQVVVRIWSSKVVHFVSVGESMQLISSFTLSANGHGMTYDDATDEIFACEKNKVSVYTKTGTQLRTYDKDAKGDQIFSLCRQITLSENKQDIYVTDQNKGLIVLDSKKGTLKVKVAVPGVSCTWPLCLLPGGICLVGGWSSGVIAQLDREGRTIGNLIDTKDGRSNIWCAVYDRERRRLLVGGNRSVISVYSLSAK